MCSAPGSSPGTFELLIKCTEAHDWSPGSDWVCDLAKGNALEITEANGDGYKFAQIAEDVTDVLLFATGSDIAPLKATLESGVLKGKSVTLYYGCRSEDSMPFSGPWMPGATNGLLFLHCRSQRLKASRTS